MVVQELGESEDMETDRASESSMEMSAETPTESSSGIFSNCNVHFNRKINVLMHV